MVSNAPLMLCPRGDRGPSAPFVRGRFRDVTDQEPALASRLRARTEDFYTTSLFVVVLRLPLTRRRIVLGQEGVGLLVCNALGKNLPFRTEKVFTGCIACPAVVGV